MDKVIWESSDFKFNKTNDWTDNTGKSFTDYYFTIEESSKRNELLHLVMEQGMQDISNVVINIEKHDIVLEVQYIWSVDYVTYTDDQMYDVLFKLVSEHNLTSH